MEHYFKNLSKGPSNKIKYVFTYPQSYTNYKTN